MSDQDPNRQPGAEPEPVNPPAQGGAPDAVNPSQPVDPSQPVEGAGNVDAAAGGEYQPDAANDRPAGVHGGPGGAAGATPRGHEVPDTRRTAYPSSPEEPAYPGLTDPHDAPIPGQPEYSSKPYVGHPPTRAGTAPDYPDDAVPSPYPGPVSRSDQTGGGVPAAPPTFTGPSAYSGSPYSPPTDPASAAGGSGHSASGQHGAAPASGPVGVPIAALAVGITAFLLGLIPVVGLVLAVVGIVLGILALRAPRGRGLGIAGLVLSGLALLTSASVLVFAFLIPPALVQP